MRHANFTVVRDDLPDRLVIRDDGPWDQVPTITNDAEWVVQACVPQLDGRRLFYVDSSNDIDELLVKNGKFAGFAVGPR